MSETLGQLGEEEVVRRLLAKTGATREIVVEAGDDCAVVDCGGDELVLLKTDAVVEGVHFLTETEAPRVGWKAAGRVMSDFGAMGGRPGELLVTLAAPASLEMSWVEGLYRGLTSCCEEFGAVLAGGETVGLPEGAPVLVSVAGTGRVERGGFVTREGGTAGEKIWVTGTLGGSFASGKHLDFRPRVTEGQWLARHASPGAMMDLSDGLGQDLPRLARASGCGFRVEKDSLPLSAGCGVEQALGDGEDMELLFTAREGDWAEKFRREFPGTEVTSIGDLTSEDAGGGFGEGVSGWEHFR